jgi:transcriptional regulator with XRE-family HTH domain
LSRGAEGHFEHLGLGLRVMRKLAKLSREETAFRAGAGHRLLTSYEKSERLPTLHTLSRLFDVLGTDAVTFFYVCRCLEEAARGAVEPLVALGRSPALTSVLHQDQAAAVRNLLAEPFDRLQSLVHERVRRQASLERRTGPGERRRSSGG